MPEGTPGHFPPCAEDLLRLQCSFILCTQFQRVSNELPSPLSVRRSPAGKERLPPPMPAPSSFRASPALGCSTGPTSSKTNPRWPKWMTSTKSRRRINNGGEYAGQFCFTAVLYSWQDSPRIQRAATDVIKTFGAHHGSLIAEDWNALSAFLSILPGNQAFSEPRRRWLLSGNYADLAFL